MNNKNKNKPLKVKDRMNMGMHQIMGTDYTLIVTIFIEDDTFYHMFSKSRLHGGVKLSIWQMDDWMSHGPSTV
uniref:Uncharacterized protein n=1 Tax=Romanomermis culicivorax TaxID=13658 RepID=A0A915J840_ROMCU